MLVRGSADLLAAIGVAPPLPARAAEQPPLVAARTCPRRLAQHRPPRGRGPGAARRAARCSRSSPRSCWCARARGRRGWKPRRTTRSRRCATGSTAPTRCCCRSRRSWWIGRRLPTSPASKAIRRSSAFRRRIACSPLAAGSMPARPARWSRPSRPCARAAKPFRWRSRRSPAARSKRRAAPSPAAPCCGLRTPAASSASWSILPGATQALLSEVASLRALIERLPSPVWTRDAAGRLTFVNAAYARAVEARDAADAVERGLELLDSSARENIARARASSGAYAGRLPAVVAGARRTFDVLDFRTDAGSAGLGIDATEAETMRSALARMVDAHRRTLDQLSTGVAMFDADAQADLLQCRLSRAVGPRCRLSRPGPDRLRGARAAARGAQAAGGAGLPAMEGAASRRLSRRRGEGTYLASARRAHVARRHHAQSGRRRHLSVRRRDRAARSRAALRGADPRPGRNARQSGRRRRRVRQRRPPAAVQSGLRPDVAACRRKCWPSGRTSRRSRRCAGRCMATTPPGRRCGRW